MLVKITEVVQAIWQSLFILSHLPTATASLYSVSEVRVLYLFGANCIVTSQTAYLIGNYFYGPHVHTAYIIRPVKIKSMILWSVKIKSGKISSDLPV